MDVAQVKNCHRVQDWVKGFILSTNRAGSLCGFLFSMAAHNILMRNVQVQLAATWLDVTRGHYIPGTLMDLGFLATFHCIWNQQFD